jgi:hypothetical protein
MDVQRGSTLPLAVAILLASAATPAAAVDGVIEINQAAALAGGITPGDTPGFPVTLSQPGSYRLTGNLDTTGLPNAQDVTVIRVTASDVSIDLNGFAIVGPVTCTGMPVTSCTANSPLPGLGVQAGSGVTNLAVACARCNREKGSRHDHRGGQRLEEVVAVLRVRRLERWRAPEEVGMERRLAQVVPVPDDSQD